MTENSYGKSTEGNAALPNEAEQDDIIAEECPLLGQLDDVVPRPLSSHKSMGLPREEAAENGNKSPIEDQIKPGFLYEIDHLHLPPRTPVQLRSIRVSMVCEKTETSVAVRYPSTESLNAFFNYSTRETHPTLDKKFVMVASLAVKVLARLVPTEVFTQQKSLEAFWLIGFSASESFEEKVNVTHKKDSCLSELKDIGTLTWGVRRQVKYLGRHNGNEAQNSSSSFVNGVEGSDMDLRGIYHEKKLIEEENKNGGSDDFGGFDVVVGDGGDRDDVEDGDGDEDEENGEDDDDQENEGDEEDDDEEEEEKIKKSNKNFKRKRYPFRNNGVKKPKKEKVEIKKQQKQKKPTIKKSKGKSRYKEALGLRDPKNRWSADRYKLAEENLLSVMKAKGATAQKPILRPQLRAEARKRIGDTGLLDHLLKHMAGKLAHGGEERFRRRHNPDGAMEYWLESADLVNIRKEAGVSDPYWVPPPGWQPGDPPTQDPICARELKLLKDDISKIKRDLELMVTKMQLEEEIGKLRRDLEEIVAKRRQELNRELLVASSHADLSQKLDQQLAAGSLTSKGDFDHSPVLVENLKQLMNISDSLKEIEEKMGKPTPKLEETATTKDPSLMIPTATHTKRKQQEVQSLIEPAKSGKDQTTAHIAASPTAEEKAAKIQRLKSGFRICKPQGTFLWPNMVKYNNNTTANSNSNSSSGKIMSPQLFVQVEVLTPPSVSSSTALAPPQLPHHHHHASLVKPLAEKRAVTVSTVSKAHNNEDDPNNPTNPNVMPVVASRAHLSPTASIEPWQNSAYGARNATEYDPNECNTSCSPSGNWLALSTFKSASDESSHG